jgi:hypothetical protein
MQRTTLGDPKSIAGAALFALMLLLNLAGVAPRLNHVFCTVAGEALQVLPFVIPMAWQTLQGYAFDHQYSLDLLRILVSARSLLFVLAAAL